MAFLWPGRKVIFIAKKDELNELKNRSLYQIQEDITTLEILFAEKEGDVSNPDDFDAFNQWLMEIDADLKRKYDGTACWIIHCEKVEAMHRGLAAHYTEKARQWASYGVTAKQRIADHCELLGKTKCEGHFHTLSLTPNSSWTKVKLGEFDIDFIPKKYVTETVVKEVNLEAVEEKLRSLKDGEKLEWAELTERPSHIRIR